MDSLIHTLFTLKNLNSQNRPLRYSWNAVSQMIKNETGQELDYDTFKQEYEANEKFKDQFDYLATFNDQGITFKSNKPNQETGEVAPGGGGLDASAKRAAANTLKRPG